LVKRGFQGQAETREHVKGRYEERYWGVSAGLDFSNQDSERLENVSNEIFKETFVYSVVLSTSNMRNVTNEVVLSN
jgi:hypothetical protein